MDKQQGERSPRELLRELTDELEQLRRRLEGNRLEEVDTVAWADPLLNASPDLLRKLADFREKVQAAIDRHPEESFEEAASPDLEDPDLQAWHVLRDWFHPELRKKSA